ncbi:NAD(P)-binding domain-containing protein [Rhodobacterales bacterium HKCCE3408]|nr:NAD(P)-binding domain-containing protein [Rhodobacterales bacterium HKCCE3408]
MALMNIAIIGTGNIGKGLARTFAPVQTVTVAGQSVEDAHGLAADLAASGLTVQAADLQSAVAGAEIVILAVPFAAIPAIAGAADFSGKVVVDVTNPIREDFSGITLGFDTSAAETVAGLIPGAEVVKAFNTVFAQVYDQGLDFGGRKVPTFVASDHDGAKAKVIELATSAGFDAVDAGGLTNARYIEPLGYLNIQFGYMLGRGTQIAPAWLSR